MSWLGDLERQACECSNVGYRSVMRKQIARLSVAIENFRADQNPDTMQRLNGAWSLMCRIVKALPPEQPPAPMSGAPEAARLAA